MKIYGVVESYQDYKGADATNWGVEFTIESARALLSYAAGEILSYKREDMEDDVWDVFVDMHYVDESKTSWLYEDGDIVLKFYIDKLDLS